MTDLELITRVKDGNDSTAMKELIERHTGIYMNMVSSLSSPQIPLTEVKDDKYFNIYQFALRFDPTRHMQFGSYVGDMTRYMCLNVLNRAPKNMTFNEEVAPTNDTEIGETVDKHDDMAELKERAKRVDDPKFYKVFCLRFSGRRVQSWRSVAKTMKMSQEGVRKLFNRHIYKLREYVRT